MGDKFEDGLLDGSIAPSMTHDEFVAHFGETKIFDEYSADIVFFFDCETERTPIKPTIDPLPEDVSPDLLLRASIDRLRCYAARDGDEEAAEEIGVPLIYPLYPQGLLFEVVWREHDLCRIWRGPMVNALNFYAAYVYPNQTTLTVRHTFPKDTKGDFSERPAVPAIEVFHWEMAQQAEASQDSTCRSN